jgi:hypothetical protein
MAHSCEGEMPNSACPKCNPTLGGSPTPAPCSTLPMACPGTPNPADEALARTVKRFLEDTFKPSDITKEGEVCLGNLPATPISPELDQELETNVNAAFGDLSNRVDEVLANQQALQNLSELAVNEAAVPAEDLPEAPVLQIQGLVLLEASENELIRRDIEDLAERVAKGEISREECERRKAAVLSQLNTALAKKIFLIILEVADIVGSIIGGVKFARGPLKKVVTDALKDPSVGGLASAFVRNLTGATGIGSIGNIVQSAWPLFKGIVQASGGFWRFLRTVVTLNVWSALKVLGRLLAGLAVAAIIVAQIGKALLALFELAKQIAEEQEKRSLVEAIKCT